MSAETRKTSTGKLIAAILVAAALWFYMFSPWTSGLTNFWFTMSFSACVLTALAVFLPDTSPASARDFRNAFRRFTPGQVLAGTLIAFALWGIFWIGDKLSSLMFDFARPQVDGVYSMKQGFPAWAIALLLLFVIGPAEEFFWRGFVQRSLCVRSKNLAFVATTVIYALVHVPSMNFMLVMAALTAGAVWGLVYRLKPALLPALMVSHALWDALVFVIIPI